MEQLQQNECNISDFDSTIVTNGCLEEEPAELESGSLEVEKWVFWGGEGGGGSPVTFHNIFYNQLEIDPCACFYVSSFTALSNNYGITIGYDDIRAGFEELKAEGNFTQWVGWYASKGAEKACQVFNRVTGKNVKWKSIPFNIQNILKSLKNGSNFVFGIKYGSWYFQNEQNDGIVQNEANTIGKSGHLVCWVKANTKDDHLIKFAEQYHGLIKKEVILVDINEMSALFQNNLIYFYE